MVAEGAAGAWARVVTILAIAALLSATGARAPRAERALAEAVALRDRIQLPGGSQLMLRREYRVIFRTPMRWSEGLLLERVHFANGAAGISTAG